MGIIRAIGSAKDRIPREQATQFPMVRSSMFMTISS